jgi:lysophospholipase L1-like esterase
MGRAAILLFAALSISAQTPYRVAFLGTSITCGAGATERFLPRVVAGLEERLRRKVQTYDLCFGGAHSLTTLLLLKHTALPWRPDLVIVETGALDGFAPTLSAPAIEQTFHTLAAARIPAVFLARTAGCSEESTRPEILRLGKAYGIPVADIPAQAMPDNCHPTNAGHAQIAASLLAAIGSARPPVPTRPPPLATAQFRSAARARVSGPATEVAPVFFRDLGAGLQAPAGAVEWRFQFEGPLAAVLFRLGHTPVSMQYQVDAQPWRTVEIQPAWFQNYYLETALPPGPHQLTLRLRSGVKPVILDGLEQLQ